MKSLCRTFVLQIKVLLSLSLNMTCASCVKLCLNNTFNSHEQRLYVPQCLRVLFFSSQVLESLCAHHSRSCLADHSPLLFAWFPSRLPSPLFALSSSWAPLWRMSLCSRVPWPPQQLCWPFTLLRLRPTAVTMLFNISAGGRPGVAYNSNTHTHYLSSQKHVSVTFYICFNLPLRVYTDRVSDNCPLLFPSTSFTRTFIQPPRETLYFCPSSLSPRGLNRSLSHPPVCDFQLPAIELHNHNRTTSHNDNHPV